MIENKAISEKGSRWLNRSVYRRSGRWRRRNDERNIFNSRNQGSKRVFRKSIYDLKA